MKKRFSHISREEEKPTNDTSFNTPEWLEAIFEGSRDAIFVSDIDSRFVIVNQAASDLTGYSKNELLNMEIPALHEPMDLKAYESFHQKILNGEEILTEAKILRKDGKKIDAEFNNKRLEIENAVFMHTTARDISDRRKSELLLRVSEERYRDLVENSSDLMCTHDLKGNILSVNTSAKEITGYSEKELIGMNLQYLIVPESRNQFDVYLNTIKQYGFANGDMAILTKKGERRIWKYRNSLRTGANIAAPIVRGMVTDITIERLKEKKLKNSEEKYRKLVELSPDAVFIHLNGKIKFLNNSAVSLFEAKHKNDLYDKEILSLVHNDYKSSVIQRITALTEDEIEVPTIEEKLVTLKGRVFDAEVTEVHITLYGEKCVLVVARDISERKIAEEIIKSSEKRYRNLFENAGTAIMEEDLSDVRAYIKELEGKGISDFRKYFNENTDEVIKCAAMVKLLDANKEVLNLLKAKNKNEVFKNLSHYFIEESLPSTRQELIELADGKLRVDGEVPIRDLEGRIINTLFQLTVVPGYEESWGRVLFSFIEVTDKISILNELRLSEEKFSNLFHSSPISMSIENDKNIIMDINKNFEIITGYSREEVIGHTREEMKLWCDDSQRVLIGKQLMAKGFLQNVEFSFWKKSGEIGHGLLSAIVIQLGGKPAKITAVLDITDRKLAEENLIFSKNQLMNLYIHLNDIRENERMGISRELHDELGQSLTALKMDLNWVKEKFEDNIDLMKKTKTMIELTNEMIKNVQRISSELRPGILDDLGLISAIEWYITDFEKRAEVRCNLELKEIPELLPKVQLTLFRILQEGLTNVSRHAKAKNIKIGLYSETGRVYLEISDDGIGISETEKKSIKSLGLIGMQERLNQFDGEFEIKSSQNNGTTLKISVPEKFMRSE